MILVCCKCMRARAWAVLHSGQRTQSISKVLTDSDWGISFTWLEPIGSQQLSEELMRLYVLFNFLSGSLFYTRINRFRLFQWISCEIHLSFSQTKKIVLRAIKFVIENSDTNIKGNKRIDWLFSIVKNKNISIEDIH